MNLGFQVNLSQLKADAVLAKKFQSIPVANISDCMNRMFAGGASLALMNNDLDTTVSGPALTVRTRPGDNLMVHQALTLIEPGDVLVVDAGGDLTNAVFGEIMTAMAVERGVAGIIINGAVRDAATLKRGTTPIFAAGVTHRGPYKDGPGEVNVPIQIGGMVINPGDLVVGDADGVVSIPLESAEAVFAKAKAKHDSETETMAKIAAGERDVSWIADALSERGLTGVPSS